MDLGSCGLNGDDCVVVIAGWRRASKAVVVSGSKAGSKEAAGYGTCKVKKPKTK
jgi:hypothetical protein